jgi:hypothetical protein
MSAATPSVATIRLTLKQPFFFGGGKRGVDVAMEKLPIHTLI